MVGLPHDVVLEILCRLGVKDLLRFRCVSKTFCSSIDDPYFINLHLSHSLKTNTNLSLIFRSIKRNGFFAFKFDPPMTVRKLHHPLLHDVKRTEILGSCNGLLALINFRNEICLFNPSTRKIKFLPFAEIELEFLPGAFWDLYLDYGFGYDPISDDYKLVRLVRDYGRVNSFDSEVKVYNLRTNSWRRIKDFPFYLMYNTCGVLANNALHWVVSKRPELDSQSFVAAIDLKTKEYLVVELPDCLDNSLHKDVHAMGGCLCLIVKHWPSTLLDDIWMMKEYGVKESWTKLISLKQYELRLDSVSPLPLTFSKNGDRVLLYVEGKELVWYEMTTKRVDKARIRGVPRCFEAEMLAESLVPLNG